MEVWKLHTTHMKWINCTVPSDAIARYYIGKRKKPYYQSGSGRS